MKFFSRDMLDNIDEILAEEDNRIELKLKKPPLEGQGTYVSYYRYLIGYDTFDKIKHELQQEGLTKSK